MKLNDANVYVGRPIAAPERSVGSPEELLMAMDDVGTSSALVWHIAQFESSPQTGNELVCSYTERDRLYGCWCILPPQTREIITDSFFDQMRKHRIIAIRAFPVKQRFSLTRSVFGGFLDEVSERGIPLLLNPDWDASWDTVHPLLEDYPNLTCVLSFTHDWGQTRNSWPLLERYPNLYIETSTLSLTPGALEQTVEQYGADRLLFGSGFPAKYMHASALALMQADIAESARTSIASGNFERLMSEVRL